jgi:predicted nucleic acid-binding protein
MSDKFFVDTNVLMYAHGGTAGGKQARARTLLDEVWAARSGVISTQVIQELCVNLQRKVQPRPDRQALSELISIYSRWEVVVNTPESVLEALELQERHGISFWDALVVQAAESRGAAVIYSEDLSDGQAYGSVRVLNPFATVK